MASSEMEEPEPGRPEALTGQEVLDELKDSEFPLTVTMLADSIDGPSRRTIHNRIGELEEDGVVKFQKYGNAKAYWPDESEIPGSDYQMLAGLGVGSFISKPAIGKASGGAVAGTGALTAFGTFVGWYSFIWLLPLLAWAAWSAWEFGISPGDLRPSRWSDLSRSFVGMQILGAWVVLGTSILARSLLGIGPGISGAPNLVVGFDVTGALFLLTTGALVWSAVVAIPTKQVSEVPA